MSDSDAAKGRMWHYRFSVPEGDEIETREFPGDDSADEHARELSKARQVPVVIHRLHGTVDWRYVTEADERA